MKPAMRLANSTTYWMALVMWCAHCCHIHSADWESDRKSSPQRVIMSRSHRTQVISLGFLHVKCALYTLFWKARVSSGVYCTQVNLFMSSALYWQVSKWDLTMLWVMRSVEKTNKQIYTKTGGFHTWVCGSFAAGHKYTSYHFTVLFTAAAADRKQIADSSSALNILFLLLWASFQAPELAIYRSHNFYLLCPLELPRGPFEALAQFTITSNH